MLEYYRLLFDFGLVTLIWLVQLVIYPSFRYTDSTYLVRWHEDYTNRISFIVMPLMVGQLLVAVLQIWYHPNAVVLIGFLAILFVWFLTFLWFVPLHNAISANEQDDTTIKKLVDRNWWRTGLWTLIFLMDLIYMIWEV